MAGFGHIHRPGRPVNVTSERIAVAQGVRLDADLTHIHADPNFDEWVVV